jgi:hypothetical protein
MTKEKYLAALKSGMFWEWFPELSGTWATDKCAWRRVAKRIFR